MLCRWKWRCCPDRRTFSRCSNAYLLHQYLWPWSYTGMYKPLGHRAVVGNLNRVLKLSLATTVPPGNIKLLNLPSWKQGIKTQILFNDKPPRKKLWRITKQFVRGLSLISWGIFDCFSASSILEYYQMIYFVLVFHISGLSLLSNDKDAFNSVAIKILELLLASFLQLLSIHPWINLKPFVCYF